MRFEPITLTAVQMDALNVLRLRHEGEQFRLDSFAVPGRFGTIGLRIGVGWDAVEYIIEEDGTIMRGDGAEWVAA